MLLRERMLSNVPLLEVLQPSDIPTLETLTLGIAPDFRQRCLAIGNNEAIASNQGVAAEICHLLSALPLRNDPESHMLAANPDDAAHDGYFRMRRIKGDAPWIFLRTILRTRWSLLREVDEGPVSILPSRLDAIDRALSDLMCCALGAPPGREARIIRWKTRGRERLPMQRWVRGHQIFVALTQGLIFSFQEIAVRAGREDDLELGGFVDLAITLLGGCAAALEFTGDFPPQDYTDIIRPSMRPPFVSETFSGLLSIDHRHFVKTLRELKPALDFVRNRDTPRHDRLGQAVSAVYESHKFVCERFVGNLPSLRLEASCTKSGVEQLEHFRTLRMKAFEAGCPKA